MTANLIQNAVKMDFFKRLSGRRVFAEIRQILEEENPTPAIVRMQDFDLLRVIHPSIVSSKGLVELLNAVKSVLAWHDLLFTEEPYLRWTVYFMVLIHACDPPTCHEICHSMELAPRHEQLLCQQRLAAHNRLSQLEQSPPETNSELYRRLNEFRTELILYMLAVTRSKSVKKSISHYYNVLRKTHPLIDGQDLIAMGLRPGPLFSQILQGLLDAKLNGEVESRDDEVQWVRHWMATH
ncbi:MAG: hypothetical protein HZB24_05585 [Desulfobacterales bacterium]|nr:hypothetical protein [Desulfobacterales bacterium]